MSTRMAAGLLRDLGELRHEPIQKRVRASIGDTPVVDSAAAVLVYEPRRVVPSYAVPVGDVRGELVAASVVTASTLTGGDDPVGVRLALAGLEELSVLDPSVPFSVHSAPGDVLDLRVAGETRLGVAFRPADPDLAGHVILDFGGFDAWDEEDERLVAHARDPFHAMDVLPSSRAVRVELDGTLLAESTRPRLLFEGSLLPVRAYLPREDVRVPLRPSPTRTWCAYKGEAAYWSVDVGGSWVDDLAWSYAAPLRGAAEVQDRVAFFNERVDLFLDGEPLGRPVTPWS